MSGPRTSRCSSRTRGRTTRSGTATRCTRSTAAGAGWRSSTPATGCSSPRPGSHGRSGWPATPGRTSCTRPSTSPSSARRGRRTAAAHHRRVRASAGSVGAPTTWVLSNHDMTRHATRYARLDDTGGGVLEGTGSARTRRSTRTSGSAAPARLPAHARPARIGVRLPGRGARPARRSIDLPEEVLADPIWERSGHTVRGRDGCRVPIPWTSTVRRSGSAAARRGCRSRPIVGRPVGQAEKGVEGSTLELYREALALRHELLHGDGPRWVEVPAPGLDAFSRGADDGCRGLRGEPGVGAGAAACVRQGTGRQRALGVGPTVSAGRHRRLAARVLTTSDPFAAVCTSSVGVGP